MKCYLDREQIERLASNSEVYRRGVRYYKEGNAFEIDFSEQNANTAVRVNVSGNYNDYTVNIIFDTAGTLKKYSCSCDAFGVWRGACKHVICSLLKIHELNQTNALQLRRIKESKNLLNVFEKQIYGDIEEDLAERLEPVNPVTITPILSSEAAGECFLTFKIGRRRKYVVKDVTEFLKNIAEEKVYSYGKDLEFQHKMSMFDRESANCVRLIQEENDTFNKINKIVNKYNFYSGAGAGRRLPLTPAGLDKFFALYMGQTVESGFNALEIKEVKLTTEPLPFVFKVSQKEDGVVLSLTGPSVFLFSGETGRYALHSGEFYKIEPAVYNILVPIFNTFKRLGDNKVLFVKSELDKFIMFLLPKLRTHKLAKESKIIADSFKMPELSKKAYLDAENGIVTCRITFCYGEAGTEFEIDDLTGAVDEQQTQAQGQTPAIRDVIGEYKFKALLNMMGFTFSQELGKFTITNDDAVYDFYYSPNGLSELRQNAEVFITDSFKNVSSKPKRGASFGLRINGSLLEISVDTEGYSKTELIDVLDSYRLKKRFHRLKDGSFIDFGECDENLETVSDLFDGLSLTEKDFKNGVARVPKYRALYADNLIGGKDGLNVTVDNAFKKLTQDFKDYKDLDFPVPKTLDGVLRGYQKEGFKWLKTLAHYGFGGVLADDMGLGKTLQVIAVLLSVKNSETSKKPSIVVAPTSLIYNWEKEIAKFTPELTTKVIAGTAVKRKELFENSGETDVYITTYDMLKRDIENYSDIEFRFIIADEAQNIKNPTTQNAKSIKMLKGETRFALTGTPMENALSELWSIFDFIMRGYLYSAAKFAKNYETPIIKDDDKDAALQLRRQISPFILRRVKSEVLTELPPKIETTLYAEMCSEQKKMYTAYLLKAKGELDETIRGGTFNQSRIDILSKLMRLRQICCHPAVFAEDYSGGSGKLDLTLESVREAVSSQHRVLIFSQFTTMLGIIAEILDAEGVEYFYLDGSTPSKERLDMAEAFNDGEKQVFLISLKAGGTGLNLTGADVVIHYDPWWNPAVMDQAADRAHRFGQQKTVQVLNIVAKDSIEEKIMTLQAKKKSLIDSVIEEGANFINKMDERDIVELFS